NVVLFGEKGVGKSSIINLLADKELATVFEEGGGSTRCPRAHEITWNGTGRTYRICDTVGLVQPDSDIKANSYVDAVQGAYELIKDLLRRGGVDLLLLCMRGGTPIQDRSNYSLFYEVLCRQKVPIAAVITCLEREVNMEEWWTRNGMSFDEYGIKFEGHACVTTLPPGIGEPEMARKLDESQQAIKGLL
ncbi:hypothetical protein BU15DRAFT_17717, partial [Melanogaster broomeanus]